MQPPSGDQRAAVMVRISAVVALTTPGRMIGTYSNFPDLAPVVLQCGRAFSSAARGRFRRFPFDSTHSADRKDQRGAVSMLSLYSAASFQRLAAVDGVESLTSILVPMYSANND